MNSVITDASFRLVCIKQRNTDKYVSQNKVVHNFKCKRQREREKEKEPVMQNVVAQREGFGPLKHLKCYSPGMDLVKYIEKKKKKKKKK